MDNMNYNNGKKMCAYCSAMIYANARFCPHCGSLQPEARDNSRGQPSGFSPTEELKVCPKCQSVIRVGELVCPKCGSKQYDGIAKGIIITGIIISMLIFGIILYCVFSIDDDGDDYYEDYMANYSAAHCMIQTENWDHYGNETKNTDGQPVIYCRSCAKPISAKTQYCPAPAALLRRVPVPG